MHTLIRGLAIIDVLLLVLCIFLANRAIGYQKKNAELTQHNEELQISLNKAQKNTGSTAEAGAGADETWVIDGDSGDADAVLDINDEGDVRAMLKAYAEQGKSFITTLKAVFSDQFVVADEGRFYFKDIHPELRPYSYDDSSVSLSEDGVVHYDDGVTGVSYGIDVSQHNGEVDWDAMKAAGYTPDFVYIRLGLRGYESGKLVADSMVSQNLIGAKETGAEVGVYFVTQAVTEEEAREEAAFVIETLSENKVDLPIALDVEKIEDYETPPRTIDLTEEEYTSNVLAFADEMKKNGYETIIYGNGKTFMLMLDITRLEDLDKWFADYVAEDDFTPYFPYDFSIWQFSSTGNVPGVEGVCDLNIRFNRQDDS